MRGLATAEQRARLSLDGLSVGDAFGERYYVSETWAESLVATGIAPAPPWLWTDDTNMALSILSTLHEHGRIDQDALAVSFADHYEQNRGYGPAMHGLLRRFRNGEPWSQASASLFGGRGSYGNGAAMRVPPLGAWFAFDLCRAAEEAELSAVVTHRHPEAIAGAVAVSVAAALAHSSQTNLPKREEFLDLVYEQTPSSEVRTAIGRARTFDGDVHTAARVLGNGSLLTAQDTVPFALWCAAANLKDYEEAIWFTVKGLGDRDTTCAIVGGIVSLSCSTIPVDWLSAREPLPTWFNRIMREPVGVGP